MACEEDSNGFPARTRNQLSLDRLFHDQAHRPACLAFGRVAANHGDDALFLGCVQQWFCARTRPFVEREIQAALLVTVCDAPDRLRRQLLHRPRHLRCAGPVRQVQQRKSPKHYPNRLDAAAQQLIQCFTILPGYSNADWATCHIAPGYAKTFYITNVFIVLLQAV